MGSRTSGSSTRRRILSYVVRAFCSAARSSCKSVITSPLNCIPAALHRKPLAAVGYMPVVWSTKYVSKPLFLMSSRLRFLVNWYTIAPIISRCSNSSVPTRNTKVCFGIGGMEFYDLEFNRKYVPEDADPDKPFETIPVRVKVIYAE